MRLRATLLLLALAAVPARAQPADPIGDLLARQAPATGPAEEDELEGQSPPSPEPEPVVEELESPPPLASARPKLTAPVNVNETGKTPDGPPSTRDLAYESRIRASFASAQGFQGPLDGSWTLSGAGGDLYAFKLVDKKNGGVEGAWRDLRRPGAPAASGFIDQVERVGSEMTLRFGGVVVDLNGTADGRWTGALQESGQQRSVSLRRTP